MTRVLVFGSRDWADREAIHVVLDGLRERTPLEEPLVVIEGGARGADTLAGEWADYYGDAQRETYPANWTRYGKAAGPIRNAEQLAKGKPHVAWGFVTKPLHLSDGSADMARRACAAGIPTYVVQAVRSES